MTSLCPDLDGSAALLTELRGDPRYPEPDAPAPRYVARLRDATRDLCHHPAAPAALDED